MYSERFSLAFVSGVLMAAAERRRPGLGAWSPAVRDELLQIFKSELESVRRSFFELFQDQAYWERLERAVLEDCFPRYAALAEKQTALEQRDYGLWRGGDLLARIAYAGAGLVVGILAVKLPFIPIPQEWDLFAFLTMIGGPFIPDAQIALHRWRYRRTLEALMKEMGAAEEAQKLYQPLGLNEPAGTESVVDVSSSAEKAHVSKDGERDPGGK